MIPIAWHCEPTSWNSRHAQGLILVATRTDIVKPVVQRTRYYGHITVSTMSPENLLLVMAHDVERLTAEVMK